MLTLEDLPKLKIFADNSNIKVNFSKIAKELGKDRRTIYYISNLWNYLNKKASILSYTCQFSHPEFLRPVAIPFIQVCIAFIRSSSSIPSLPFFNSLICKLFKALK